VKKEKKNRKIPQASRARLALACPLAGGCPIGWGCRLSGWLLARNAASPPVRGGALDRSLGSWPRPTSVVRRCSSAPPAIGRTTSLPPPPPTAAKP